MRYRVKSTTSQFRLVNYSKTSKNDLNRRRPSQFITNFGITVGFSVSSLSNGYDEMPSFGSLRLSCICWIGDEHQIFFHVACEEEMRETPFF